LRSNHLQFLGIVFGKNTVRKSENDSDKVLIALRKVIRASEINSRKLHKRIGLTVPQFLVLKEIKNYETSTPGEIAQAVSLSQATVTGILGRLETRNLIRRQRDEKDKRRVIVSITDTGQEAIDCAPPLMQEAFVACFNKLQLWEQTMILSALQRLHEIMEVKTVDEALSPNDMRMDHQSSG
jgi:DNA-binding MarR family transcriptional regulator